jgi:hypothetical protein
MNPPAGMRVFHALIRIYPPGARRTELLDTCYAMTRSARRWPTPAEAYDLVVNGLRARLGRPASRLIVLTSLLFALAAASGGACLGGFLAVQANQRPLPAGADSTALSSLVLPGRPVLIGGDPRPVVRQQDLEGIEYGYAEYLVEQTGDKRDVAGYTTAARDRLSAAGWRITQQEIPPTVSSSGRTFSTFTATRDGLTLRFSDGFYSGELTPTLPDGQASFTIWRETPALPAAATAGALVGAVFGWLLTCWASRRLERHPTMNALARIGTVVLFIAWLPVAPWGFHEMQADESSEPFFGTLSDWPLLTKTAAAAALALLGLAFLAGEPKARQALRALWIMPGR